MIIKHEWLSTREAHWPGTIRMITGSREICVQCGSPFRRMATDTDPRKFICGTCYPVQIADAREIS